MSDNKLKDALKKRRENLALFLGEYLTDSAFVDEHDILDGLAAFEMGASPSGERYEIVIIRPLGTDATSTTQNCICSAWGPRADCRVHGEPPNVKIAKGILK